MVLEFWVRVNTLPTVGARPRQCTATEEESRSGTALLHKVIGLLREVDPFIVFSCEAVSRKAISA